jgi:hypothetical protein
MEPEPLQYESTTGSGLSSLNSKSNIPYIPSNCGCRTVAPADAALQQSSQQRNDVLRAAPAVLNNPDQNDAALDGYANFHPGRAKMNRGV